MGYSSKGGAVPGPMPGVNYGGALNGKNGSMAPPNPMFQSAPSLPLVGASNMPPQYYSPQSMSSGLVPGLGSGPMQSGSNPPGGGFYGGDALGTAGQLLSDGTAPSFNASAGGNVQGIGYWPGSAGGVPGAPGPGAPTGKGGGPGLSSTAFGSGGSGKTSKGGAGQPPPPGQASQAPPGVPTGAGAPPLGAPGSQYAASPSWSAAQLAQANGLSPGLADYMYEHDQGNQNAGNQFMQAAGFTNAPGSQTMLNQAGRNWVMNNDQTYGDTNADTGQPSPGGHIRFGMTSAGVPYSYDPAQLGAGLNRWSQGGGGAPPAGVTLYNQFGPQGGAQVATAAPSARSPVSSGSPAPTPNQHVFSGSPPPGYVPTPLAPVPGGTVQAGAPNVGFGNQSGAQVPGAGATPMPQVGSPGWLYNNGMYGNRR